MNYKAQIYELLDKSTGIITTKQITNAKIPRMYLTNMVVKEELVRTGRGIYTLPNTMEDEIFGLQSRYSKGVFSHETAAFLHNLTDRIPNCYTMTFPLGYNSQSLKDERIKVIHIKKELYDLGLMKVNTPLGQTVNSYNVERTMCDIVRHKNKLDVKIFSNVMKSYVKLYGKNILLLMKYAKLFNIEKPIQQYLEVLL